MSFEKKVQELMISVEDYPHVPHWFSLRQAMAIVREKAIELEAQFEPRAVLVFDEDYDLKGILTLRDIIKGLAPKLFGETTSQGKPVPNLPALISDLFGPGLPEASQRPVNEVLRPIKAIVQGNDSVAQAIFLMIQEDVGLLPVIQDNKVAGIVRLSDLFLEISDVVLGD